MARASTSIFSHELVWAAVKDGTTIPQSRVLGHERGGGQQARAQFRKRDAGIARNLAKLSQLPIALWDERLSTAAVERELIAADVSRKKRAAVIDQHAAAFILQGALDRLERIEPR